MPPKKDKVNKKTEMKKKDKVIDDKTFGLKNKKGSKQQKYIENVNKQVMSGGKVNNWALEQEKKKAQENKKRKEAELAEMELLFGKAIPAKKKGGNFGDFAKVDPKAKSKKADIYKDKREEEKEDMSNWTEEQLREAIAKKHGAKNKNKATTTDKICNIFLQAVENFKYGWFWECPNGDKCKYKHCLPEGYVLKRDLKKMKQNEEENKISLEDLIERERAALGAGTKITLESFNIWKKKKRDEKKKKAEAETKKKKGKAKSNNLSGLTGRELFQFNAEMGGDDEEAEDIAIEREVEDDEVKVHDVNLESFEQPSEALKRSEGAVPTQVEMVDRFYGVEVDGSKAATPTDQKEKVEKAKVEVDEDLFGDEDIDLGDIDEQLGDLALEEAGMS